LLHDKRTLVIGAGPNIGMGIAQVLGADGAELTLVDASEAALSAGFESLKGSDISARSMVMDLCSRTSIDAVVNTLTDTGTLPDVVVFNAGLLGKRDAIGSLALDDVEKLFRTNIFGHWYLADQLAARISAEQRAASFVFITSIHEVTLLGIPSYSASKAALSMLVRELAYAYAPLGIRVNAVAPGWVALNSQQELPHHRLTPIHERAVHPHNIGLAVLHFASDERSGQTTGATLTVDAGLSLHSYLTAQSR
jgi:3-oxoacyl-[acyl-carrier protein] reductase